MAECGALPLRTWSDDLKLIAETLPIATEQKPVGGIAQPRRTEVSRVRDESDNGRAEGVPVIVPFPAADEALLIANSGHPRQRLGRAVVARIEFGDPPPC